MISGGYSRFTVQRKLIIRNANSKDLPGILNVNLKAIFETCSSHYKLSDLTQWVGDRDEEFFGKSLENDQLFVCESKYEVVAFLDVIPGEILAIFTDPVHEGKGIGTKLMKLGMKEAGNGRPEIVLYASLNAVSFYERFGFLKEKETTHPRNGIQLPVIEMKYRLHEP